jgi:hypothetical protein
MVDTPDFLPVASRGATSDAWAKHESGFDRFVGLVGLVGLAGLAELVE